MFFLACFLICGINAAFSSTVTISSFQTISSVPPDMAGFSFEWSATSEFGKYATELTQLFKNLRALTNVGPRVRIGGDSSDTSWWNPNGLANPDKISYSIVPENLQDLIAIAKSIGIQLVLGLNMASATDTTNAVELVKGIKDTLGGFSYITSLEIGNEPDYFGDLGFRPTNYQYSDYVTEFENYAKTLEDLNILPTPFFQGATFCCRSNFIDNLPNYIPAEVEHTNSYSVHPYAIGGGSFPTDDVNTWITTLLDDNSGPKRIATFTNDVQLAHSKGKRFVFGESNSVSGGGQSGVSNSFAAALWGVDWLSNAAAVGVNGINFHGGGMAFYSPVILSNGAVTPQSLYYGMYFFTYATRANSIIIPANVVTSNSLIKFWTFHNTADNTISVLVNHKSISDSVPNTVTVEIEKNTFPCDVSASVVRLTSPQGITATSGFTMSGLSFNNKGAPTGQITPEKVTGVDNPAVSYVAFTFTVPPGSLALLIVNSNGMLAADAAEVSASTSSSSLFSGLSSGAAIAVIAVVVLVVVLIVIVVIVAVMKKRRQNQEERA